MNHKKPTPTSRTVSLRRALAAGLLFMTLAVSAQSSRAEDLVWATGKVLDERGSPMAGALVAVYDDRNKVVDYARTDGNGEYALAVPSRALHLEKKHGRGFIAEVFTDAIRFSGDVAGFVTNPVRAGVRAITSSEAANMADPITKGEISAGGVVADRALAMLTPRGHRPPPMLPARRQPGALMMKVIARDRNDLIDVGRVYWLQQETYRAGGHRDQTLAVWLDPVRLTPADSERPSHVESTYLRFAGARLEPSLAERGQRVRIVAKLPSPPDPAIYTIVIARDSRTGRKWELAPVGDGRYEGELTVDKHFPYDDQTISIIAYASVQDKPGRRPGAEKAIESAGLWNPARQFVYDPTLTVSRNRADLILTVVKSHAQNR